MSDLLKHVQHIANTLENGFGDELNSDGEDFGIYDYLQDVLDIEYVVDKNGEYLGARILVAFGGPNIWIDTRRGMVDGYHWSEKESVLFRDNVGLDDAIAELWCCK